MNDGTYYGSLKVSKNKDCQIKCMLVYNICRGMSIEMQLNFIFWSQILQLQKTVIAICVRAVHLMGYLLVWGENQGLTTQSADVGMLGEPCHHSLRLFFKTER